MMSMYKEFGFINCVKAAIKTYKNRNRFSSKMDLQKFFVITLQDLKKIKEEKKHAKLNVQ